MDPLQTISLCTGIGGLDLGVAGAIPGGLRVICVVEREAFAIAHLEASYRARGLVVPPIWTDLELFDGEPWRGKVDCIVGGYPCQPFSLAGKGGGQDDPRHLWPHVARIVAEVAPKLCVFENVPGHIKRGLDEVLCDLERLGYSVGAGRLRASDVGSVHRRERVFVVAAYPDGRGLEALGGAGILDNLRASLGDYADGFCGPWESESGVGRVADGVSNRVDRLRALGNSVVPLQAALAVRGILDRMCKDADND